MTQTKKGNVVVIAIIIVLVAITAGVIGWLFAKQTQTQTQISASFNGQQQSVSAQSRQTLEQQKPKQVQKDDVVLQDQAKVSAMPDPLETVKKFYTWYTNELNAHRLDSTSTKGDLLVKNSGYITEQLYSSKIKEPHTSDVWLCGQDDIDVVLYYNHKPEIKVVNGVTKADVNLAQGWKNNTLNDGYMLNVKLILENGVWKINEIPCTAGLLVDDIDKK